MDYTTAKIINFKIVFRKCVFSDFRVEDMLYSAHGDIAMPKSCIAGSYFAKLFCVKFKIKEKLIYC